jgi:hypothetical protein
MRLQPTWRGQPSTIDYLEYLPGLIGTWWLANTLKIILALRFLNCRHDDPVSRVEECSSRVRQNVYREVFAAFTASY